MDNETYQPVPHNTEFREQLLNRPDVNAAFEANAEQYALLDAILTARLDAGLTQTQVAQRMGVKKTAIARLESKLISEKQSPSLNLLQKYAAVCGKKLDVQFSNL